MALTRERSLYLVLPHLLGTKVTETSGVSISRALAIDGWMSERELTWLAQQAREISSRGSSVFVEIGTWKGRSARAIGDNLLDGSYLWCVDAYDTRSDLIDSATRGEAVFNEAQSNLRDLVARRQVLLRRWDSAVASKSFSQASIKPDFVFIDGSHDYESVRGDINAWLPLLRDGKSVLCGHDYGVYPGVGRAVKEAFGNSFETVKGTSIWVMSSRA